MHIKTSSNEESTVKLVLPPSVSSLQDVNSLMMELREYAKWFAHNEIKHQVHAKKGSPPPEVSSAMHELLRSWTGTRLLTSTQLNELVTALDALKRSAPVVSVTLAAPVTHDLKVTIVNWCREHIDPQALVSFAFTSTILGGIVIRYGSHVHDWSFRKQLLHSDVSFAKVLRNV